MARVHYRDVVVNSRNQLVAGASVQVNNLTTGLPVIATLYADATGSATLANPLTTNSLGEFEFYLESAQRVQLTTSGSGLATKSTIVDVLGPHDLGVLDDLITKGPGADVRAYNADPTGAADSTVAIQAAINAVQAAGGGIVLFSPGIYLVGALTLAAGAPVQFVGAGWSYDAGAATILRSTAAAAMFTPVDGSNGHCFRDLVLDGANVGTRFWSGAFGNKARFENLLVENFTDAGIYSRQGLLSIRNSYVRDCTGYGLDLNSDSWVFGTEVHGCGVGIRLIKGGNRITDCLVNASTSYGVFIDGSGAGNLPYNNAIIGGYIGENTTHNIYILGNADNNRTARNNKIIGTHLVQTSESAADGIYAKWARTTLLDGVEFIGGADNNAADTGGITLEACEDSLLSALTFDKTTINPLKLLGVNDTVVSGLVSRDHGNATVTEDQSYGVYIDNACNRVMLSAVRLVDNRGTPYSRGIKNLGAHCSAFGYLVHTSVATPDSLGTMTVVRHDHATKSVQLADSAWDGPHPRIGNYHLWVDASGNLRIKSGKPNGDLEGTIVGAQGA
jgi:hypothetical protein